jgi:hypothetical protein
MTLETVMLIAANKPIKLSVVMLIVVAPELVMIVLWMPFWTLK